MACVGPCPPDTVCDECQGLAAFAAALDADGVVATVVRPDGKRLIAGHTTTSLVPANAGSRFVTLFTELGDMCASLARLFHDPEVQQTGAQFFDTLAKSSNRELGAASPMKELDTPTETENADGDQAED